MRKKIILGFIFTTTLLLITPIVTSINEPIVKKQENDIERAVLYWCFPCICTFLFIIHIPIYLFMYTLYAIFPNYDTFFAETISDIIWYIGYDLHCWWAPPIP